MRGSFFIVALDGLVYIKDRMQMLCESEIVLIMYDI